MDAEKEGRKLYTRYINHRYQEFNAILIPVKTQSSDTVFVHSIKQIQEQLDAKQEWYTRVLYADEHVATILAGSNHNVQKGDVFNIYNEKTFWISENGEIPVPCESKLQSTLDGEPIASIEIFDVSPEAAAGKVVFESGIQIKMGAKVKIRKLVEPVATTTASSNSSSAASSSVKKASLSTNSVRKLNR